MSDRYLIDGDRRVLATWEVHIYGIVLYNCSSLCGNPFPDNELSSLRNAITVISFQMPISRRHKDQEKGHVLLQRQFNIIGCLSMVGCLIIGSGIYVGPTAILNRMSSPGLALLLWGAVGLVSIVDNLVCAEWACTFPACGAIYLYLEIFYGPAIAFLQFWEIFFIARPGYNAIKCLLAAT